MKKTGLVAMLIICLVIGGVYATWDYAQGPVDPQTANLTVSVTDATTGTKGTIGISGQETIKIIIDDDGTHHAADATGSGQINIIFTPAEHADTTVTENGIKLEYILEPDFVLTDFKFNNVQVFTAVNTDAQILNGGVESLNFNITGENLANLITVNKNLELATKEEYDQFSAQLANYKFKLTIQESK